MSNRSCDRAYNVAAVALSIPFVWSDQHRSHDPAAEIWIGVRMPAVEVPERAEAIRLALEAAGAELVAAAPHGDAAIEAVHDTGLLSFLERAWREWEAAGLPDDPGQDRVVPYVFPHPGLLGDLEPLVPTATWAQPGAFCFDTMTLIGPGTWEAARAAADAALTAADLVSGGEQTVYACCRPPGHHVTRRAYGGSCYLNNAAIAAQRLRDLGVARVAIIDIDAHHGNGAQSIFWERDDVLTASVHVDPVAGWFPHYLGTAAETGAGAGRGANLNVPLTPGTADAGWLAGVTEAAELVRRSDVEALVLALGVDAAALDPESPLQVTEDGYRAAGGLVANLDLPCVVVQEGGYDLASIGGLVLATLEGIDA
jgi:acetoin utilization deacetylase AcuC-like enzyme